jgi:intracellular sulfur oxidation DsrE/DsrF family protein
MNRNNLIVGAAMLLVWSGSGMAQSGLPVAGYDAARDVPGAHMLPNPATEYKVVFDIAVGADNIDEVNPRLEGLAEYVNTLAKYGVPAEKRKIAVVFHRGSTEIILKDAAFKARNDGHSNPNIALIQSLAAAGVKFHVCGQAVLARKIDSQDILPEIQLDLWALTTLIELGLQGYVRIGG